MVPSTKPAHIGAPAEERWKVTVQKEKVIAANWPLKWNWMIEEYRAVAQHLQVLKKLRPSSERPPSPECRPCKPLPDTSAHMVGWLVGQPEFNLDLYGPYYKKIRLIPPPLKET